MPYNLQCGFQFLRELKKSIKQTVKQQEASHKVKYS